MNYLPFSSCPDCGGSTHEIEITDYSTGVRVRHYGYSLLARGNGIPNTQLPETGEVKYYICLSCGRVMLAAPVVP
jgi:hypothetical protein